MKLLLFIQLQLSVLRKVLISFFPVGMYKISGTSMEPLLVPGSLVVCVKKEYIAIKKNHVIILKDPRNLRIIVKRVKKISKEKIFVVGDNALKSTDSRTYGWVSRKHIIGKVIYFLS